MENVLETWGLTWIKVFMIFILDPESRKQLSDILQFVPVSEGIYLLNTMTNMIECCSPANTDLINAVTLAVFEVSLLTLFDKWNFPKNLVQLSEGKPLYILRGHRL